MKNKNGYTIVEVIVSFVLILVVMIYLLRTIVVLSNKNNDLLAYEEYSVYENQLLKEVYEDVDMAYELEELQSNAVTGNGNIITFKDINKTLEIDEANKKIIYDGKIYELPENVNFRKKDGRLYDIREVNAIHKAYIIKIYTQVNKNEEEIEIVYQNKKLLDYTITFDPNGGTITSGQASVTTKYASVVQVPTAVRDGYTLDGWYTPSDKKLNGNTVRATSTITYKAKWTAKEYTLAYELDGGSHGSSHPTSATYDKSFTVNNPSKNVKINYVNNQGATIDYTSATVKTSGGTVGYTFAGWNITGMDSVTHTYGDNTTTSTTLTGIKATTFKNLRGTSGTVNYEATWTPPTITLPKITRPGYTCVWTSSGINNISSGGTYSPAAVGGTTERTFTVNCGANTYTVTYNGNGATGGSTAKSTHTYDVAKNLTANGFSRTGYNFIGWNTVAGGTGTAYLNSQSVKNLTTSGNYNLFAQWNIINYTISYNLNGGSVSGNPTSYNVNTATFTLKNPGKSTYNFAGWTGSNGSTKQTTVSIAKGSTGNKSYTANWSCPSGTKEVNSKCRTPLAKTCTSSQVMVSGKCYKKAAKVCASGWTTVANTGNSACRAFSHYSCSSGYELWTGSGGPYCWKWTGDFYCDPGFGEWPSSGTCWRCAVEEGWEAYYGNTRVYEGAVKENGPGGRGYCGWYATYSTTVCPSGYTRSGGSCYKYTYNENASSCASHGGSFSQTSNTTKNGTGKCTYTAGAYSSASSGWVEGGWHQGETHWNWTSVGATTNYKYQAKGCPSGYPTSISATECRSNTGSNPTVCNGDTINGNCYKKL